MPITTYCTSEDIAKFLQLKDNFSSTTDVTKETVETIINMFEDEVDRMANNAWREKTITAWLSFDLTQGFWFSGRPIYLLHKNIKTFDAAKGDYIRVYHGTEYTDYLETYTEGRENEWWCNYVDGKLYIKEWVYFRPDQIKVKYRYGNTIIPGDIKRSMILLTAAHLLMNEDSSQMMRDSEMSNMNYSERVRTWKREADRIIRNNFVIRTL